MTDPTHRTPGVAAERADLGARLRIGWNDTGAADRVFLRPPSGAPLTYADVERRAARMAAVLGALGATPGDRVVVAAHKSPDAIALYLACLQIGAVFVPVNPAAPAPELAFFVSDAEPAVTVVDPDIDEATRAAVAAVTAGAVVTLGVAGDGTLAEAADRNDPHPDRVARDPDDLAAMLYTSGTTGRPKGAMLTNRGLVANAVALADAWGFGPDDVLVHCLPIFHVHGLFVAVHCAMLAGAEVRFLPRFDVDEVLTALGGASVMMGVPTHYGRLLDDARFDADVCAGMRLFTSGSAPMTEAMHRRFTERTGHRILERYGMTEAGIITSNPLHGERIPGTVGFALPGVDLRVATTDGPCGPGEPGVVEVRGPHQFAGYWRLPERTTEAHRPDGWFVTGDVGTLDDEGRLTLAGRAGDMIISGGENVYPKEIERCLDEHPDVGESAVVGLPHPDLGEAVVAFVLPSRTPTPDETIDDTVDIAALTGLLRGRLSRHKHPRAFFVVDDLPRNAMGKVQKNLLRTDHADHFDQADPRDR